METHSSPTDANRRRPSWLLRTPARRDEPSAESPVRALLVRLMRGHDLSRTDAAQLFGAAMDERATDAQIGAALVALAIKGETVEELTGMAEAMRARAVRIDCRHERFIDTAGTGSSQAKTFNVSTAAAFVCAGAGLPVAKHGSRAATSLSGSADVLSELGVNVQVEAAISERCLNEIGICFLYAPLYHQATARVAGIRRQLGVHTTFNLLGPLTNPAGAPRQIIGVWHESLLEPLAHTLLALGIEHAWVVHGSDGLDEVTTSGLTTVAEARDGGVRIFMIQPNDFGLKPCSSLEQLRGGNARDNAQLIRAVLRGETGARQEAARDLMIANAAAALFVGGVASDLRQAAVRATESIQSGAAFRKLEVLCEQTNAALRSTEIPKLDSRKRVPPEGLAAASPVSSPAAHSINDGGNFLEEILVCRRAQVARDRAANDPQTLRREAKRVRAGKLPHRLREVLRKNDGTKIIGEFKRTSPSLGEIRSDAGVAQMIALYERGGVAAISVLTEPHFFKGSLDDLREARATTQLPILRKDFIVDEFQVEEAAAGGADAILLIVAALSDAELSRFRILAEEELGLDALVEVHDAEEMERAVGCGAKLVGVNNRDLRTFVTSLETSIELAALAPAGTTLVSESGISSRADIEWLRRCGYRGFLIGESLLRAADPVALLESLRHA